MGYTAGDTAGSTARVVVVDVAFGEVAEAFCAARHPGIVVVPLDMAMATRERVLAEEPDVVVIDVDCDGDRARELLEARRPEGEDGASAVRFVTVGTAESRGDRNEITRGLDLGAARHFVKPLTSTVVAAILAVAQPRPAAARYSVATSSAIVGVSAAMRDVLHRISRVAPSDLTVLVMGESGTGKELIAREIHAASRRRQRPFVAINCAAVADGLIESELFGHEKGAFTGAASRRIGRFEQANGGTLFLDEIGDMSPSMQARVLRVLQEGVLERVGGNEPIHVDVRTIAATHRDLRAMMRRGEFREDLYYRLAVVSIRVPPLRERREDIATLVDHFIARHAARLGRSAIRVHESAHTALCRHDWPGNVRQLSHCLEQAILLSDGAEVALQDIEIHADGVENDAKKATDELLVELARESLKREPGRALEALVRRVEDLIVAESLTMCGNNLSRAAWLLGVSRPTLRERIRRIGFEDAGDSVAIQGPSA